MRHKKMISVNVSPEVFEWIEDKRGLVAKSVFLNDILEKYIRQSQQQEKSKKS